MRELSSLWREASRLVEAGHPAALATVARQRGSLPMASDAKMLVTPEGRRRGTVGGGCVEAGVVEEALRTLETRTPAFARHTLNADLAGDIGLSCGGTVDLFLEPLLPLPDVARLCDAVADGIDRRARITLVTQLEWGDDVTKAAFIDDDVIAVGPEATAFDPAQFPHPGGGRAEVDGSRALFVEWLERVPRVVIFGAGHVGAAISRLAAATGFYVVIVDDREEFANPDRLPAAHEVVAADFHAVFDRLTLDEDDYVLATTRGHGFDAQIVERAAPSAARYVGMLGSRRKEAVIRSALETAGVSRAALARVKTPIGLGIGAETPAEIAVAVVAELVRIRRGAEPAE